MSDRNEWSGDSADTTMPAWLTNALNKVAISRNRLRFGTVVLIAIVLVSTIVHFLISPFVASTSALIGFAFPQAENGQYPNGATFSISDVVSRPVLEEVWRKNKLAAHGVTLDDFLGFVSIVPYVPTEDFLRAKYQVMLGRKGLTTAEVAAIEREYQSELTAQAKKSVRLVLTTPLFSPLSGTLREKILQDIPAEWSSQAIANQGVVDIPVSEKGLMNHDVLKQGSMYQVVDYFYKSRDALAESLDTVVRRPGGADLRDPQSGASLADLARQLDDIERYWIVDFDNHVQQGALATQADVRAAQVRILEMKERKESLLAASNTFRNALLDYDAFKSKRGVPSMDGSERRSERPQLSLEGDALQELLDLGAQSKEVEFRQSLTNRRVEAELEARQIDPQILRLERRLAGARMTVSAPEDLAKRQYYVEEISKRMHAVADSLARIQVAQRQRFLDARGLLYSGPVVRSDTVRNIVAAARLPIALVILILIGSSVLLAWSHLVGGRGDASPTGLDAR